LLSLFIYIPRFIGYRAENPQKLLNTDVIRLGDVSGNENAQKYYPGESVSGKIKVRNSEKKLA